MNQIKIKSKRKLFSSSFLLRSVCLFNVMSGWNRRSLPKYVEACSLNEMWYFLNVQLIFCETMNEAWYYLLFIIIRQASSPATTKTDEMISILENISRKNKLNINSEMISDRNALTSAMLGFYSLSIRLSLYTFITLRITMRYD